MVELRHAVSSLCRQVTSPFKISVRDLFEQIIVRQKPTIDHRPVFEVVSRKAQKEYHIGGRSVQKHPAGL